MGKQHFLLKTILMAGFCLYGLAANSLDVDGDGLTDVQESAIGTSDNNPDSDFDSLNDGWEFNFSDPVKPLYVLEVGTRHNCAIGDAGTHCWGYNEFGQATAPGGLSNPYAVEGGRDHTCALDDNGVSCWGSDTLGQISTMPTITNPVRLSAGYGFTCVVDDDGVKCWGDNSQGQVSTIPVLTNPVAVSAGYEHACALDDNGVSCWGSNSFGQAAPPALTNPREVHAGWEHTCAVDDTGIVCWGSNAKGQLNALTPNNLRMLSVGRYHNCLLDDDGVRCWGSDANLQSSVPRLYNPWIVGAGGLHTCAADDYGVHCWGNDYDDVTTIPVAVDFDADNDGMDDGWEISSGLDPLLADDTLDADSDMVTNLAEYLQGTGPNDAGEVENISVSSDMNNDDVSDLLFYRSTDGTSQNWLMLNHDRNAVLFNQAVNTAFSPISTADMDGDGDADILWRNVANGKNTVWLMEGGARNSIINLPLFNLGNWIYQGVADFDGDRDADILWRNAITGQNRIWTMVGGVRDEEIFLPSAPATLSVKAIGDFNGDNIDDVYWQKADGSGQVWLMNSSALVASVLTPPIMNIAYTVEGAADFDLDGDDDLLIRNAATGQNTIWVMQAGSRVSQSFINAFDPAGNYVIAALGDYDGDGDGDIFWRNTVTGQNRIWEIQNNVRSSQRYPISAATTLTLIP